MAKNLLSSGLVDIIELSQNVSMVEINIKKDFDEMIYLPEGKC